MKPKLQQEAAERAESFFSMPSVISCSNPLVPSAGSKPMKDQIQQEQTEVTEKWKWNSLFSLLPPVQMSFVQIP
jgi:hypothetical protein